MAAAKASPPVKTPARAPAGAKIVYRTLKNQVNVGANQHLGFAKGKGYYAAAGAPDPVDPVTGLTHAQLAKLVSSQVASEIAPQRSALSAQENADMAKDQALQRAIQNITEGYRQVLSGIGPQVQGAYDSAGNSIAAYGKGFSDVIQGQLDKANGADQGLLSVAGATPGQAAAVKSDLTAPTDALYATGGAIPAGALQREGAAFTSAADELPAVATAHGAQALTSLLGSEQTQRGAYDANLAKLLATIPNLRASATSDILKNARADEAQQLLEQKYGLQQRTEIGNETGVDPATGKPTAKVVAATQKAHQSAVVRRNKSTASALTYLQKYIDKQHNVRGAKLVGYEPIYKTVPSGDPLQPSKKVQIGHRPVYDDHAKIAFNYGKVRQYVMTYLQNNLGQYGYTQQDFANMADDLLGPAPPPAPAPSSPAAAKAFTKSLTKTNKARTTPPPKRLP